MKPRHALWLCALLLWSPEAPATEPSLAGQVLVASPNLGDGNFRETVVVMVTHDAEGALGLVVNRPLGEGPLESFLRGAGLDPGPEVVGKSVRVHAGGPVEPGRIFLMHSDDWTDTESVRVAPGLALSPGAPVLGALARGEGPEHFRVILGYAGWAAGQLESELARDDWTTAPAAPDLAFGEPGDIWEEARKRSGLGL